jgi:hypothetical protein
MFTPQSTTSLTYGKCLKSQYFGCVNLTISENNEHHNCDTFFETSRKTMTKTDQTMYMASADAKNEPNTSFWWFYSF